MAEAVLMPKSGISVESCIIGEWKKKVGDEIKIGDILLDYETDKAAFECDSTAEGTLLEIFFESGDEVEVLKPICAIGKVGDDVSAIRAEAGSAVSSDTAGGAGSQESAGGKIAAADAGISSGADAGETEEIAVYTPAGEIKASPRAKNLAEKLGTDIAFAIPTGPHGRIIEADVRNLYERSRNGQLTPPIGTGARRSAGAEGEYTEEKLSKIRTVIAKSMQESLRNTAQLTHHHSFDATEVLALRKEYKAEGAASGNAGVSIGDMILYGVVQALKEHPDVNALLLDGNIVRHYNSVHLGVAIDTPRGLIVPTVFDADKKSLQEISREVKELAETARKGNINPDLLRGATFTVSNLGPTGVEIFTPIINPPQAAILGVCGTVTRIKSVSGGIATYPAIGLSLTYDHRVLDGAPASKFAQKLAEKLEHFKALI